VIAEIIPEAYDAVGRPVSQPFHRRRGVHPTFPMGRYVSQPLAVKCKNVSDIRFWTWRQLLSMGCDARVVFGRAGRYGAGHAWVMFFENGRCFLVEPTLRSVGETMPRLSTIKYKPGFSVAWNGKSLSYYAHKDRDAQLGWRQLLPLVPEWTFFWGWFWLVRISRFDLIIRGMWRKCRRRRAPAPK
jgi:hypothetical protein